MKQRGKFRVSSGVRKKKRERERRKTHLGLEHLHEMRLAVKLATHAGKGSKLQLASTGLAAEATRMENEGIYGNAIHGIHVLGAGVAAFRLHSKYQNRKNRLPQQATKIRVLF
jgi:hypothetical protein